MFDDEMLLQVLKPARYIGNEINMIEKNPAEVDIRFAFAFPDVYEVGMSHLGLQILYNFMNQREDTYCERVFMPWVDMLKIMKEKDYPLFALETLEPIKDFDFLGFTLQYEMSYTNIIAMLDLAKIPYFSKDRGENFPIICAGGPCAYNSEPLAEIVDFFYIGEAEVNLNQILDIYKNCASKNEFLEKILDVDGVYVPKFYAPKYSEKSEIIAFEKLNENAKLPIQRVALKDIDEAFFPKKQLVPIIETVHDRVTLEVFRGCIRGCRFCQAGYTYRPQREKKSATLLEQADCLLKNSGHEEISLVSLSTGDYSEFKELTDGLLKYKEKQINISLPSLRIDAFSLDLMEKIQEVRKSGLTFAPEAGTQRLRDVINKNISEEEILDGCKLAFSGGFNRVKLYFMIGLPTETDEDIIAIAELAKKIVDKFYELPPEKRKGGINVVISTSCFVPKPFTPFQFFPQNEMSEFMRKQRLLKENIKSKSIKYNYHDSKLSFLEAVFAKGDRRLADVIIKAYENGAIYDAWTEHFNYHAWEKAFAECGIDPKFYAYREFDYSEILPWEHIAVGVDKKFFIDEYEKALKIQTTANCRESCSLCGAHKFNAGVCYEK